MQMYASRCVSRADLHICIYASRCAYISADIYRCVSREGGRRQIENLKTVRVRIENLKIRRVRKRRPLLE